MKKVYIVMGSTGEYSDRSEWSVMAYLDESLAEERVTLATKRAKEIEVLKGDRYAPLDEHKNEYDPDMRMDYTGTSYYIIWVELCEDENVNCQSDRRKAITATKKRQAKKLRS